ncbi:WD repeat and SOF1 domain-containing protein [Phycomyces blakesleeanus]
MKVKALSRSTSDYVRERAQDTHKVQRNLDPALHPFEKGREYVRALNTVKLERLFAKPFVGALSGHIDGVYSMAKHPQKLSSIISGSGDGELRVWDLSEQATTWRTKGHTSIVNGVPILSCSSDKTVKIWNQSVGTDPIETYMGKNAFTGLTHHRSDPIFATSGHTVDVWDETRSDPIHSFEWGADSYQTVKFNQVETNILASCGQDRTIVLYDLRTSKPLSKLVMAFSMDSKYVLSGSDDGNIRLWKAKASEKLGVKDWREKNHLEYAAKLKERYSHMDEIKRIDRHRHTPYGVKRADSIKKEMLSAQKRKEDNRRKHSKKGTEEKRVSEREKAIIGIAK